MGHILVVDAIPNFFNFLNICLRDVIDLLIVCLLNLFAQALSILQNESLRFLSYFKMYNILVHDALKARKLTKV